MANCLKINKKTQLHFYTGEELKQGPWRKIEEDQIYIQIAILRNCLSLLSLLLKFYSFTIKPILINQNRINDSSFYE